MQQWLPTLPSENASVAVLSDRPLDYIPAMLAAFQIGALYVPLDPKAPLQRQIQILEDVQPDVIALGTLETTPHVGDEYTHSSFCRSSILFVNGLPTFKTFQVSPRESPPTSFTHQGPQAAPKELSASYPASVTLPIGKRRPLGYTISQGSVNLRHPRLMRF